MPIPPGDPAIEILIIRLRLSEAGRDVSCHKQSDWLDTPSLQNDAQPCVAPTHDVLSYAGVDVSSQMRYRPSYRSLPASMGRMKFSHSPMGPRPPGIGPPSRGPESRAARERIQ